jgi:hypothetical protein
MYITSAHSVFVSYKYRDEYTTICIQDTMKHLYTVKFVRAPLGENISLWRIIVVNGYTVYASIFIDFCINQDYVITVPLRIFCLPNKMAL